MKVTRALLLSSKNQAEAWEYTPTALFRWESYRYLVDHRQDSGNIRFSIFCVHQEPEKGTVRQYDIVAPEPHVEETFEDMGRLINFLHRYQIDFDNIWEPVE